MQSTARTKRVRNNFISNYGYLDDCGSSRGEGGLCRNGPVKGEKPNLFRREEKVCRSGMVRLGKPDRAV